jgi:hypothetical protein
VRDFNPANVSCGSWLCENCYMKKMYKMEFSIKAFAGDARA